VSAVEGWHAAGSVNSVDVVGVDVEVEVDVVGAAWALAAPVATASMLTAHSSERRDRDML
jgi:hypothetical protein